MGCDIPKARREDEEDILDVSKSRRDQAQLKQFCAILDNMQEGVVIKNAVKNEVLFANETAKSILHSWGTKT